MTTSCGKQKPQLEPEESKSTLLCLFVLGRASWSLFQDLSLQVELTWAQLEGPEFFSTHVSPGFVQVWLAQQTAFLFVAVSHVYSRAGPVESLLIDFLM